MSDQRARGQRPKKSMVRELAGIAITALVISLLIKTFLFQAFSIPSGSMEDTLLTGDRVIVNKLADQPDEIRRGDVVVFRDPGGWLGGRSSRGGVFGLVRDGFVFVGLAPSAGNEHLIKRVIGVGGDTVACCTKGKVTVNGALLDEPYLNPGDKPSLQRFEVKVPADRLWVMGDHRASSADSRAHLGDPGGGFVPVDHVVGRAFVVVWPFHRASRFDRPETFENPRLAGTP